MQYKTVTMGTCKYWKWNDQAFHKTQIYNNQGSKYDLLVYDVT